MREAFSLTPFGSRVTSLGRFVIIFSIMRRLEAIATVICQPNPDPGCQKSAEIMEISTKINQNHKNIIFFFSKLLNLCITDLNIYPINNKKYIFWRNWFLRSKKSILSTLGRNRSRIRIRYFRIHVKMKQIRNTA